MRAADQQKYDREVLDGLAREVERFDVGHEACATLYVPSVASFETIGLT
jgi:hypothetical protein